MLDTGSWVPLIASWPGKIPAGSVYNGLTDFTDIMPTCLDLAGVTKPAGLDGVSFAPQLEDKPGKPRLWVFVLHADKKDGLKYFVRDIKWKLFENGELYDVSDSPYTEKQVKPQNDTRESKATRERLGAVLRKAASGGDGQANDKTPSWPCQDLEQAGTGIDQTAAVPHTNSVHVILPAITLAGEYHRIFPALA